MMKHFTLPKTQYGGTPTEPDNPYWPKSSLDVQFEVMSAAGTTIGCDPVETYPGSERDYEAFIKLPTKNYVVYTPAPGGVPRHRTWIDSAKFPYTSIVATNGSIEMDPIYTGPVEIALLAYNTTDPNLYRFDWHMLYPPGHPYEGDVVWPAYTGVRFTLQISGKE